MTQPIHTLDVGPSLFTQAVRGVRAKPSPNHLIGIIMGAPGSGKSVLAYSNPKGFVINADCASQSGPLSKAAVYPAVNSQGQPVALNPKNPPKPGMTMKEMEEGGHVRTLTFSWQTILDVVADLEKAAARGDEGLPEVVYIDTVSTCISLIIDWMLAKATVWDKDLEQHRPAESLEELHGLRAWPAVYGQIINVVQRLRRAGYGVYLLMHTTEFLADDPDPNSNKRIYHKNAPRVTTSFWERLDKVTELIVLVELTNDSRTVDVPMKKPNGDQVLVNGKPKYKKVSQDVKVVTVHTSKKKAPKLRVRGEMDPSFEVPAGRGWDVFEQKYAEGAEREELLYDAPSSQTETPQDEPAQNGDHT